MDITELYQNMRSIRRFTQEPVTDEQLHVILENLRIMPNGMNAQSLTFVVVKSKDYVEELNHMVTYAGALPREVGTPKDDQYPPVYLVIVQNAKSGLADIDAGIAAGTVMASATAQGLASCIFASHSPKKVGDLLHLNEDQKARLVIAIGHPGCSSKVIPLTDTKAYHLDEDGNFEVPKRALEDIYKVI
jgi:nitroreductase